MTQYVEFDKMSEEELAGLSIDQLSKLTYKELVLLQELMGKNQEKNYSEGLKDFKYPASARERLAAEVRNRLKIV